MGRLSKRVWENRLLKMGTKIKVYEACVLSTLLYGSETWSTYCHQECSALSCMAVKPGPHTVTRNACLNTYHLQCLMQIMSITWRDKIPYSEVLRRAKVPSMYALLSQRRLRWLGHVHRMENTRIPKSLLYGQLASGSRDRGRPLLWFRDACKRDATDCCIDFDNWERLASDQTAWRSAVTKSVAPADKNRTSRAEGKRKKKDGAQGETLATQYVCQKCGRSCSSRIGHYSHTSRCAANRRVHSD